MNFKEELEVRTQHVNQVIGTFLPQEEGFTRTLAETMRYNMEAPGKRLRPIMMEETYHMAGGKGKAIMPLMTAMEMIHTHSLIHDDLPALDNDDYRRGRKTTHVIYGEALAILSGDTLLNYAYETALKAFSYGEEAQNVVRALTILSKKSGIFGMLGGQSVDVMNDGRELSLEMLDFIYEKKTSALIEASLMAGAALAGASEEMISDLEKAGHYLGLAFQIRDDILDVEGGQELGKPIHSDEKNGKTTYVTLKGMDEAKKTVADLSSKAMSIFQKTESEFLLQLAEYLVDRKK